MVAENTDAEELQRCLAVYREQLAHGEIATAYYVLLRLMGQLKAEFPAEYKTGSISPGYLDYTYFPFWNASLRARRLRFGVVLNHSTLNLELWLMAQNANVQREYWEVLRNSPWNEGVAVMPKYHVLAIPLWEGVDFTVEAQMRIVVRRLAVKYESEVQDYLAQLEQQEG